MLMVEVTSRARAMSNHSRHSFFSNFCTPCALLWMWLAACQPSLNVGQWTCSEDGAVPDPAAKLGPVALPWSSGFEQGFCDYTELSGFCYAAAAASYTLVTEPVHSGAYAAAFNIVSGGTVDGHQTRCVRQGALPDEAYYGAWYYVPARATNTDLWNLLHFQGGDPTMQHGLWDVSLVNGASGALELVVYDFLNARTRRAVTARPIPIGAWFHVEFYLKRAADNSGAFALYQDGQQLTAATGLKTDDTSWGQWYVGNLATGLTPPASTLYVDDVTIRASR